jgi:DNA-binding LacI/PurR family transcriptional regulator
MPRSRKTSSHSPRRRVGTSSPERGRAATIVDVAQVAGVTHSTVSRALNGDPRVRPATRERIFKAVEALDYHPNLAARGMKSGYARSLGVVLGGGAWVLYNAYFGRLLAGLSQAAEREGSRVVLYLPKIQPGGDSNPSHDDVELRGIDDLREGRVDGAVLLSGALPTPREIERLRALPFPTLLFGNNVPIPGFHQLLSGAYDRTRKACDLLLARGCRRVGMVGLTADSEFNAECRRALVDASRAARIRHDSSWFVDLTHWAIDDAAQVQRAVSVLRDAKVDGIVFAQVEQAIAARGLQADVEIPFVSFGEYPRFLPRSPGAVELLRCDLFAQGARAYGMYQSAIAGAAPRTEVMDWQWER